MLSFAKRDLGFCPVGMAAFIFLLPPFLFPAGFRSYDWVSHIGVISGSQTCLSAGADNCAGPSTKERTRGGRQESGREILGDRPLIYSHLLQSFLIDLACLHQQLEPGMALFFLFFFSLSHVPAQTSCADSKGVPAKRVSVKVSCERTKKRPRTHFYGAFWTLFLCCNVYF